jgi:lipopolysaccharide export system protein LptA
MIVRLITALVTIWLTALTVAAFAQAQQLPGRDPDAPIEIEADTLEVRQEQQLAVFTGNVVAVQGGMTLKTDEMQVRYRQDGESSGASVGGAISRLEAIGNVIITTAKEKATGKRGIYNVDPGIIDLEGGVVLSNADGELQGQSLRMNLRTGISVINGGVKSRVKGVFTPQKKSN